MSTSTKLEWCTSLVAHELERYTIDIEPPPEKHFENKCWLTEWSDTFFCIGKDADERKRVGFVIAKILAKSWYHSRPLNDATHSTEQRSFRLSNIYNLINYMKCKICRILGVPKFYFIYLCVKERSSTPDC